MTSPEPGDDAAPRRRTTPPGGCARFRTTRHDSHAAMLAFAAQRLEDDYVHWPSGPGTAPSLKRDHLAAQAIPGLARRRRAEPERLAQDG